MPLVVTALAIALIVSLRKISRLKQELAQASFDATLAQSHLEGLVYSLTRDAKEGVSFASAAQNEKIMVIAKKELTRSMLGLFEALACPDYIQKYGAVGITRSILNTTDYTVFAGGEKRHDFGDHLICLLKNGDIDGAREHIKKSVEAL